MAIVTAVLKPLPPPNFPWVDKDGRPTLEFAQYVQQVDVVLRLLASGRAELLTVVAAPSNANAAAAGVAVGGFYIDSSQIVHQRTA